MLGRQRMSATQARSVYEKLQPQAKIGSGEVFKASKFEELLKSIFKDEKMQDLRSNACKTCVIRFGMHRLKLTLRLACSFVCAMNEMNMNAGIPQIFRSYNTLEEPAMQCMLWEAARATSATPGLFKPMQIGSHGQWYIDGGVGHNNPTSLAFEEAKILYPSRAVVLVTSIGSGHPDTIQIAKSPSLTSIANMMKQIATDCEKTHEENMRRFPAIPSAYFRFNVQQGMQGLKPQQWGKSKEVLAHTNVYLRTESVKSTLTAAVKILLSKLSTLVILPTNSW